MYRFFILAVMAFLAFSGSAHAAQPVKSYKIDPAHTRVVFFVNHLGLMKLPGQFSSVKGTLNFDTVHAEASSVKVAIDAEKFSVGSESLDSKLQGKDWLNTGEFSQITFVSTDVEKTGVDTGILSGNLTFLGVTRPVQLKVKYNGRRWNKYAGAESIGFTAKGSINRSDFGMKAFLPDVGDDVALRIEFEADEIRDTGQ